MAEVNNFCFKIKDRNGREAGSIEQQDKSLRFLYETVFGRIVLKILTRPFVSKIVGAYMNSRRSAKMIGGFVKKQNIDMSIYENKEFISYNDFFTRKLKQGKRPVDMNEASLISPCDSKLTVYPIGEGSLFYIKESVYSVSDLLGGNAKASEFDGGLCLIFRLAVDDYHRYCYFDTGTKGKNVFVGGELHTVNPIALNRYNIYKRNCREYTFLQTDNFGECAQIEVGAMMVGKIKNLHQEHSFKRGEEKGLFEFGGSTVILLIKKDRAVIDDDIILNSKNFTETVVKFGEKIGVKFLENQLNF